MEELELVNAEFHVLAVHPCQCGVGTQVDPGTPAHLGADADLVVEMGCCRKSDAPDGHRHRR